MSVVGSSWLLQVAVPVSVALLYIIRHSLPLSWHLRVLLPFYVKRWKSITSERGSDTSTGQPLLRLKELPIGKDPFSDSLSKSFHATIDECDFLGHLSNSSYPKNLDVSRSHYAAHALLQFAVDGGWVPLGSVTFKFIKEIPVLARYNIRSSIYAWDEKWFYLKNEFVIRNKDGSESLHCLSISKHCYKLGRKTIPPWFVMAYSGYSPASSSDPLSNWKKSQELRIRLQKIKRQDNPLKAFQPVRSDEKAKEDWMSPDYWDLGNWQDECSQRLKDLYIYY